MTCILNNCQRHHVAMMQQNYPCAFITYPYTFILIKSGTRHLIYKNNYSQKDEHIHNRPPSFFFFTPLPPASPLKCNPTPAVCNVIRCCIRDI